MAGQFWGRVDGMMMHKSIEEFFTGERRELLLLLALAETGWVPHWQPAVGRVQ